MKKIILAFDSFKGSAGSIDIAQVAESAIKKELPDCEVFTFPIADGGEGTTNALCYGLDTTMAFCIVHDSLMRPIEASYAITNDDTTAILEMASANGLPLVEKELRNPMNTTTFGTGEIILDALNHGCRKFIMGIGGSATNDAGIGMLTALGVRFLDANDRELEPIGKNLINIARIDTSKINPALKESSFIIACDVNNPFAGENGAAYIYAPQKGASESDVIELDKGLKHYAKVIEQHTGINIRDIPGSGAAGGMGGGVLPFMNAKLQSGIDIILETLRFEEAIKDADLIFTGEGKIDAQSIMGKMLDGIVKIANKHNIPTIALAGAIESTFNSEKNGLTAIFSIQPSPTSLAESMQTDFTLNNIHRVILQIVRIIKQFGIKP